MSEPQSVERILGNHDARIAMVESRVAGIEGRIDARFDVLQNSMAKLSDAVTSARGFWSAWRTVGYIIVGAGAVSGAVATVIHYLLHGF